ncbi:MAG: hypothetical protein ACREMZ_10170 [Gemmatimonadales bacterium]
MRLPQQRLLLVLSLASGCNGGVSSRSGAGHLEARWTGADTGAISAAAVAEWCDERRLLQIRAVRGDTGFAVALYPPVILALDSYPVLRPGARDSVVPSARVALRWFGPTSIEAYQGDRGAVVLEGTDSGNVSGSLQARARSVSTNDQITLTGTFRNLTIVPETRGCVSEPDPEEAGEDLDELDEEEYDAAEPSDTYDVD